VASNKKITDLDEIASNTVADDDVLAIVDVSQNKTYKIRKDAFQAAASGVTSIEATSPLSTNSSTGSIIVSLSTVPINKGGTNATTALDARTNLGLGSIATQDASSVAITGGTATLSSATVTSADVNGGTIDGTPIGSNSASTGAFTTLSSSGGITGALTGNVTGNLTGNVTGDITGDVTGGVTGDVTGNLTGDVTSSGTSTFTTTTHSGTSTFDEDVTLTGASYNAVWDKSDNRLEFEDNAKVSWGSASDLEISHDGSNSYITEQGTGDLYIRSTGGDLILQTSTSENGILIDQNDAVTLYFNNNAKVSTTNTGITVTGDVDFTGSLKENGSLYKPSFTGAVLEELHSLCNTTSLKGKATIENVTTHQDLTTSYADITGSKVSAYTCPAGTSEIVYEFNPLITSSGSTVISHWKLYYSTNGSSWTEVTQATTGLGAGSFGQQKFPIRWVFKVNAGSDDSTVGQFSAATPTLYFKWQAREFNTSYPGRIHGTYYWDGISNTNQFSLPSVSIKAIA
jgi:hypothetical protein